MENVFLSPSFWIYANRKWLTRKSHLRTRRVYPGRRESLTNINLFHAQSWALNPNRYSHRAPYVSIWTVLYFATMRDAVFATRLRLCTRYPLRAQEPIRSRRSVCRRRDWESTFDPPLNYDGSLQKPKKASRLSLVRSLAYLCPLTMICQDENRRVHAHRAFPVDYWFTISNCRFIAFSDNDWFSLFEPAI